MDPEVVTNAAADFSQANYLVGAAIDGNTASGGWGLHQPDFVNKGRVAVAVFETLTNVGFAEGTRLTFTLRYVNGQEVAHRNAPSPLAWNSSAAISNKTYAVQYTESLHSGPWLTLTNLTARLTNRTEVVSDPAATAHRFYRLSTPAQP